MLHLGHFLGFGTEYLVDCMGEKQKDLMLGDDLLFLAIKS